MLGKFSRAEIEARLENGLKGRIVCFIKIDDEPVRGIMQRLAVDVQNGELIIIFVIGTHRYEADIVYFDEHLTFKQDGDSSGRYSGNIRRFLQRN